MLLYSLNTSFTESNSSWPIFESIQALEINTSMVLKLVFVFVIFPCFFFFHVFFLIAAVIQLIFNPIAELAIPTGLPD